MNMICHELKPPHLVVFYWVLLQFNACRNTSVTGETPFKWPYADAATDRFVGEVSSALYVSLLSRPKCG